MIIIASIYWTLCITSPCANPHSSREREALLLALSYSGGKGDWQRLSVLRSVPLRAGTQTRTVGLHITHIAAEPLTCISVCRPGTSNRCTSRLLTAISIQIQHTLPGPDMGRREADRFCPCPGLEGAMGKDVGSHEAGWHLL